MVRQKLHVLEVIASQQGGGAEHLLWLIKGADESRFDFTVLIPGDDGGIKISEFKTLNVKLVTFNPFYRFSLRKFFALRNLIEEGKFDIVHFHGIRAAMLGRISTLLMLRKPKIVYTIHGFHLNYCNPIKRSLLFSVERFLNRFTDVIICVSYSDKKTIIEKNLVEENKITVIWNGIDIEKFQRAKVDKFIKKKELGLPIDAIVITMIGRLHPQKDHETLLSAFRLIIPILQNAHLLIVGDGPLRLKLERYAQSLGLKEKVKFTGFRKDIPEILAITDIFVLSTLWEGLPLALLEALASAKPVIASDIESIREVVVNEEVGLLVPPKDPKTLAQAIIKVAKNPKKARNMGENGLRKVKEHFGFEVMAKKTMQLYENLLV